MRARPSYGVGRRAPAVPRVGRCVRRDFGTGIRRCRLTRAGVSGRVARRREGCCERAGLGEWDAQMFQAAQAITSPLFLRLVHAYACCAAAPVQERAWGVTRANRWCEGGTDDRLRRGITMWMPALVREGLVYGVLEGALSSENLATSIHL